MANAHYWPYPGRAHQDAAGNIIELGDSVHGKITYCNAPCILYPAELHVDDRRSYHAVFADKIPMFAMWEAQAEELTAGFMAIKVHQYRYDQWRYEWYFPKMAIWVKVQCSLPYSGTTLDVTAVMQSWNF